MQRYWILCERNYQFEETLLFFLPCPDMASTDQCLNYEALYYMIYYADWNECEGNFSTFEMDMEHDKQESTVDDMMTSASTLGQEFQMFHKLEGRFQWPFDISPEQVVQLTPLQMAAHLNETLAGGKISNWFL